MDQLIPSELRLLGTGRMLHEAMDLRTIDPHDLEVVVRLLNT